MRVIRGRRQIIVVPAPVQGKGYIVYVKVDGLTKRVLHVFDGGRRRSQIRPQRLQRPSLAVPLTRRP